MSNYLDTIRKRSRKALQESEQALKSNGELESGETKGVGLPKAAPVQSGPEALKSTGALEYGETKGVGLRREDEDPKAKPWAGAEKDKEAEKVNEEDGGVVEPKKAAETSVVGGNANAAPMVQGVAVADPAKLAEEEEDPDFDLDDDLKEEEDPSAEKSKEDEKKEKIEEEEAEKEEDKAKEEIKEHVNALIKGENLSEGFQAKATAIFEAAVASRVKAEKAKLVAKAKKKLKEARKCMREEMASHLDTYLDYVVEQWVEQNKVAIQHSLRTEITESFIGDLKSLFEKHNIELPEAKYSVVDEMKVVIEDTDRRLNEEAQNGIRLRKQIRALERQLVIQESVAGLTKVQADKLVNLCEGVSFDSKEDFKGKVSMLKESHFGSPRKVKSADVSMLVENENGEGVGIDIDQEPRKEKEPAHMSAYLEASRKLSVK